MQVSDNETMRINVTLVQHSCLDGIVNIRDGGGEENRDDVVQINRNSNHVSDRGSKTMKPSGELINKIGFFNRTGSNYGAYSGSYGGLGGGYSFNSTRPVVTFELTSRNKSCRVNMQLKVVAVPAKSKFNIALALGPRCNYN